MGFGGQYVVVPHQVLSQKDAGVKSLPDLGVDILWVDYALTLFVHQQLNLAGKLLESFDDSRKKLFDEIKVLVVGGFSDLDDLSLHVFEGNLEVHGLELFQESLGLFEFVDLHKLYYDNIRTLVHSSENLISQFFSIGRSTQQAKITIDPFIVSVTQIAIMSAEERGRKAIEDIVRRWTSKYLYHITYLQKQNGQLSFMVEFSLPTPQKPIPIATVQVYFFVKDIGSTLDVKFRFQKDSLVHTPGKSIRDTQMEKWIESLLLKKLIVRENVFYLGSEYELTRVKDPRQDRILQKHVEPVLPEYVYIAPQLLADQRRSIDIMEPKVLSENHSKISQQYFNRVDTDRLGVVTIGQFLQILKDIGLKLTAKQAEDVVKKADKSNTGLVAYQDYAEIIEQSVKGMIARRESLKLISQTEEEFQVQSIMMLIDDKTHELEASMLEAFKKLDEDEKGFVKLAEVKKVLEDLNATHNFLHVIELAEFTKGLSEKYLINEVKYEGLSRQLLEYKLANLKKGLIQSSLNNLEVYLREIFDPYDKDKYGRIHVNDMLIAIEKSDKIVLTSGQLHVLRSVVERDDKDIVDYIKHSKEIAGLIKRLYTTSNLKSEKLSI